MNWNIILVVCLLTGFMGCAHTCPHKSCMEIYCNDGYVLTMRLPYTQEEWLRKRGDGEEWTATFRCAPEEER